MNGPVKELVDVPDEDIPEVEVEESKLDDVLVATVVVNPVKELVDVLLETPEVEEDGDEVAPVDEASEVEVK